MNYIIEILDNYEKDKVIATKRAYTIEEIKTFYREEYPDYKYRVYELTNIDIWK